MLDRLKDVWYYTPLPPHNGYNDEALNCCIVHDCTTIYFGMSVKILLILIVRFLHRTDDQLFSQINRTIAEMLLLRKIQNRPEKKYKEHILRNGVPNISVTCWWWDPEYVIWLWVGDPVRKGNAKWKTEQIQSSYHDKSYHAEIMRNFSLAAETSKKKDVQYCSPPLHGVPHAAVGGGALPGAPPLPLPCLHHHQLPPVAVHPSGSKRFEPKLCRIVL